MTLYFFSLLLCSLTVFAWVKERQAHRVYRSRFARLVHSPSLDRAFWKWSTRRNIALVLTGLLVLLVLITLILQLVRP